MHTSRLHQCGTVVTTYTFDASNRLMNHSMSTKKLCWCPFILSVGVVMLLAGMMGCTYQPVPTAVPQFAACSEQDRLRVAQTTAPHMPISDTLECMVQLLAIPDKVAYLPEEPVTIIAMISMQGDCSWSLWCSHPPMIDFAATEIMHDTGKSVLPTEQGQELWDTTTIPGKCLDNPRICGPRLLTPERRSLCWRLPIDYWFDISASGNYSMTLVRTNTSSQPRLIHSDVITFTRLP